MHVAVHQTAHTLIHLKEDSPSDLLQLVVNSSYPLTVSQLHLHINAVNPSLASAKMMCHKFCSPQPQNIAEGKRPLVIDIPMAGLPVGATAALHPAQAPRHSPRS
jgi:hypothetical protein